MKKKDETFRDKPEIILCHLFGKPTIESNGKVKTFTFEPKPLNITYSPDKMLEAVEDMGNSMTDNERKLLRKQALAFKALEEE